MFQYLIDHSGPCPGLSALPLSCITLGGDRCKRYTLDLIRSRLPSTKVYITYGLSEAGPRVSTLPHDRVASLPDSIGLPLKGVEVSILDGDARRCAPYECGEIVVRSPSLMSGYFGDVERTNRVIRGGLCHTGDIGYLDEHGFLYYVGRKDRQFKIGGRSVNPAFIERCLASHPQVQEVVVLKAETERDESICAKVKAKDVPEEELVQDLTRLCRQHFPAFMIPGKFHVESHDRYYYKGKLFVPRKEQLPPGSVA
jgi:acyl-CoA synthetase (AMP-forming)/AMP-acid ligase II